MDLSNAVNVIIVLSGVVGLLAVLKQWIKRVAHEKEVISNKIDKKDTKLLEEIAAIKHELKLLHKKVDYAIKQSGEARDRSIEASAYAKHALNFITNVFRKE